MAPRRGGLFRRPVKRTLQGVRLVVVQGDLTEVGADALVNAPNNHGYMGGGVAGALKREGGAEIEREAVRSAFSKAHGLRLRSIAFPSLGTGVGGPEDRLTPSPLKGRGGQGECPDKSGPLPHRERGKGVRVLKIGCCGFPGGRQAYYAQFPAVEVQQTFYKPPKPETAQKWRQEAPLSFEFTLKAWQLVTHHASSPTYKRAGVSIPPGKEGRYGFFRPTEEVWGAWEETVKVARALKATAILFQCPARFSPTSENIANLRRFFRQKGLLPRDYRPLLVWEPRGEWEEAAIARLCGDLALVHCLDPSEGGRPVTGAPYYLRLHGGPRYAHQYTDGELARLADALGHEEGYCFFNNSVYMAADALRFMALVGTASPRRSLGPRPPNA